MINFFNKLLFLSTFNRLNDELKLLIKVSFPFTLDLSYIYMHLKDVFHYMYVHYIVVVLATASYVLFTILITLQGKIMIRMVAASDPGCAQIPS